LADDEGSPQFVGNIDWPTVQSNYSDPSAPKERGPQNDKGVAFSSPDCRQAAVQVSPFHVTEKPLEDQLREEFNRWAEAGRGDDMEQHHLPIVEPMLALIQINPRDKVLDVGCGTGWLVRRIAPLVSAGLAAGMDVSNAMVRRAEALSAELPNVVFARGGVDAIPWDSGFFTTIVSVESAYYWPDPAHGLREIFRVLAPGGSAWILINYYRDNPHCQQWGELLKVPTHLLSAKEWGGLLRQAGFGGVGHRRIPDPSPTPDVYTGRWFRDAEQMRNFKQEGALLLHGAKSPPLADC
jgi:SAM-dependent methyltransferase